MISILIEDSLTVTLYPKPAGIYRDFSTDSLDFEYGHKSPVQEIAPSLASIKHA